jgi:ubiquinone/menaquinone biosynthesis C-methylase UbiE
LVLETEYESKLSADHTGISDPAGYPGQIVVDIGSGIDVFLAANKVKDSGKVFGIDMTDEMLEKARNKPLQS